MTLTYGDLRAHIADATEKKEAASVRIGLPQKAVMRLDSTKRDKTIDCWSGKLWITQTGNPKDYFLVAGERLCLPHAGRVVIEALDAAVVGLSQ